VQRPAIAFSACTVDCAEYKYVGCRNMCCGFVVYIEYRYSFVNMDISLRSAQRVGRGPYSVWRQTYVAEDDLCCQKSHPALAPEVELMVRELFMSQDMDVEDVSVVVCFKRLDRAGHSVGRYTFAFVIRGYPMGIFSEEVASWAPDMSSIDHRLVDSCCWSGRSKGQALEFFRELIDMYYDDGSSVQFRQYCRSVVLRKFCVAVWRKQEEDPLFKETKSWTGSSEVPSRSSSDGGVCPAAVNERKRKADDSLCEARKKAKATSMVSC
jgi:hypothetical protein